MPLRCLCLCFLFHGWNAFVAVTGRQRINTAVFCVHIALWRHHTHILKWSHFLAWGWWTNIFWHGVRAHGVKTESSQLQSSNAFLAAPDRTLSTTKTQTWQRKELEKVGFSHRTHLSPRHPAPCPHAGLVYFVWRDLINSLCFPLCSPQVQIKRVY